MDPVVVDFETRPIIPGSGHTPVPVGVSILIPGCGNTYWSWGHPGHNPHTWGDGRRWLASVWDQPLVFHNCKFDIGVAIEHMDLPWPKHYDDTMFQAYLVDPLTRHVSLKTLAATLLNQPPEEKDAVYCWLKANFKGPFLPDHKMITPANAGAYICYAPYEVVAPYAMGDTQRTRDLHRILLPKVEKMGMRAAYERELKIAKVGYSMQSLGVRVDRKRLQDDAVKYQKMQDDQDVIIRSYLGKDLDVDKRADLAVALLDSGYCENLPKTPTGKISTAKGSVEDNVTDPHLLKALRTRSTLQTLNGTFFKGWLAYSEADGRVHPSWNQVAANGLGARTGRFSCSEPNLTNVPTEFGEGEDDVLYGVDLPFMRRYLLPDEGQVIIPADYNGQEMRGLAHYAEGEALQIYKADPRADFHSVASELILRHTGMKVPRKTCKIVGFSLIYGSGIAMLAKQLGVSYDKAERIRNAYFKAMKGLREFMDLFRHRDAIKTWGGRILPCPPPAVIDGEYRTFNYKLINYLIQGSAADQTKEAILRYDATRASGRLLMAVHDELVISVPAGRAKDEVKRLRASMEEMPGWDVPFVVDVEYGDNWHDLKKWG